MWPEPSKIRMSWCSSMVLMAFQPLKWSRQLTQVTLGIILYLMKSEKDFKFTMDKPFCVICLIVYHKNHKNKEGDMEYKWRRPM